MKMQEASFYLLNRLRRIYDEGEADKITDMVMEHLTGSKKAERMIYKNSPITPEEEKQLKQYTERLLKYEPVQYILKEAWFYNTKFYVDKNVLIPRPETEELVDWVLKETKQMEVPGNRNIKILDVGTGSGCIAVALKKFLPVEFEVWACDINDQVLTVARKNADDNGVLIDFVGLDFLDEKQREQLPHVDIIVSNPPYVPERDKNMMKENVVNYEPHSALFVPNEDSLIFYKAIADFGKEKLQTGGNVFVEIHENLGKAVTELFEQKGYSVELRKDMQGKERMIKAASPPPE